MNKAMNTDEEILRAIRVELAWDPGVDMGDLVAAVHCGVVTLTGTARTPAERHAAQVAAHRALGVLRVTNHIHVNVTK